MPAVSVASYILTSLAHCLSLGCFLLLAQATHLHKYLAVRPEGRSQAGATSNNASGPNTKDFGQRKVCSCLVAELYHQPDPPALVDLSSPQASRCPAARVLCSSLPHELCNQREVTGMMKHGSRDSAICLLGHSPRGVRGGRPPCSKDAHAAPWSGPCGETAKTTHLSRLCVPEPPKLSEIMFIGLRQAVWG